MPTRTPGELGVGKVGPDQCVGDAKVPALLRGVWKKREERGGSGLQQLMGRTSTSKAAHQAGL